MRAASRTLVAVLLAMLLTGPGRAAPAALRQIPASDIDVSVFRGLAWRPLGPSRTGRVTAAAGTATAPHVLYLGVAGGGVWASPDLGRSWRNIFDESGHVGAIAVAPSRPATIYVGTGEGLADDDGDVGRGLFKSTDAGRTWSVTALPPAAAITRIVVDPRDPDRLLVATAGPARGADVADQARSDDGGATWTAATAAPRTPDEGPLWRSDDGRVILRADPGGAKVTVNGGETWHALDQLPTAAFSRLATDAAFPYRVCGMPASGGAVCLPVRGEAGPVTARDWLSVPLARSSIATDPGDGEIVYTGAALRYDRRTGQLTPVGPPDERDLTSATPGPLAFTADGRTLYYATTRVWRTTSAVANWIAMGPTGSDVPIRAIAPSAVDPRQVWIATAAGRVQRTTDAGATWADVTPAVVREPVTIRIEPSHFDARSAYLTLEPLNRIGGPPRVLRTRDGGASWTSIAAGLPATTAYVVREDALRRGFLVAGTGEGVWVSFDDGERWQSLRVNMPRVAVRDIVVKDADLLVATAGRGIWVLDDISPLRQLTGDLARADAFLFRPTPAWRVRARVGGPGPESPLPDGAWVPPDRVWLQYLIGATVAGPVTLEVIDTTSGDILARFSSDAARADLRLDAAPGLHRVAWDGRLRLEGVLPEEPGAAALRPPAAVPGIYQVRLAAGGRVLRQAIALRLDPRLRVPMGDLRLQFTLARRVAGAIAQVSAATPAASGSRAAMLRESAADLTRLGVLVQQADGRPGPSLESALSAALARADALLQAP